MAIKFCPLMSVFMLLISLLSSGFLFLNSLTEFGFSMDVRASLMESLGGIWLVLSVPVLFLLDLRAL